MWDRVSVLVEQHRRRIAGVVLVLFVLGVALDLSHTVPRQTQLAYDLGADHRDVRMVELAYTHGEEAVEQARHRYSDGAPARLTDEIDLVPGRYEVRVDLSYEDGHVVTHEGRFEAPGQGTVVVQWTD